MEGKSFLLISHELTYTGAPRSLLNIARYLTEGGHRVSVWSLETGDFFEEFAKLGIDVMYVKPHEIKSGYCELVKDKFDLVIANTVFCTEAALEFQKYIKTVLFLGEARNIKKIVSDFSMDVEKIKAVENIVCVSSYAKRALEGFLDRNDISVIHNCVEDYMHKGEPFDPEKQRIRFIVSGTVEQRKAQDLAIAAYRGLAPDLKKKASLHILGKAPTWSQKYFKSLKFGNGVFYRNEIQNRIELLEYYKKTDVIIVPSRDEACSLVALEAAMLGKALIVSSHVGAGYVCPKEFRFKSGDVKELQAKMEMMLKKPELIADEGKECRKLYKKYAVKNVFTKEMDGYLKRLGVIGLDEKGTEGKKRKRKENNPELKKLRDSIKRKDKALDNKGKPIIPIVFATDSNYAPFAATVIKAICDHKSNNHFYSIYILYDDTLTYSMYELLNSIEGEGISVRPIDVSSCVEGESLYLSGHYSMQMYYRWLIPELFKHYDKILYLDCDLGIQGDVARLYETDIGDAYVGMVNNTVRTSFRNYVEDILDLPVDEYYNSGVILFNNKAYINNNVKERCIEYINRNRDLLCPDQDAINVICKGNIYRLPDEWNFQWHHMIPGVETGGFTSDYKMRYERVLKKGPKIIHYTSYKKPWDEPELKLADIFWKYFKQIPLYDKLMRRFAYGKKGIEKAVTLAALPSGRVEERVHYKERIDFLQHSLDETRNSATYKIGRAITAVPRRVRHMLTGAPI